MRIKHLLLLLFAIPLTLQAQTASFPLKEASRGGDLVKVVALLDAGAAVDQVDDGGNTALISASWHGHANVVAVLLQRGADAGHRNADGYAGLDYAMERGNRTVVHTLLEIRLRSAEADGRAQEVIALKAVLLTSNEQSESALPNGLQPDLPNASGYGPLAMASRWGASPRVQQLLALGADPNAESISRYNTTPLMEATRDGHVDIARLLVAAGADVNHRDRHGDHALNWAAYFGHNAMVQFLVDQGSRLDFIGQSPETAQQIATREGHLEAAAIIAAAEAKRQSTSKTPGE